jgi:hypothetical protein
LIPSTRALLLLIQADGFSLNVTTLAVVTTLVGALAGAIALLFRKLSEHQRQQIEDLTDERDLLLDKLFDMTEIADRSTGLADDAAKLLLKRRKGSRRTEPPTRESRR